MKKRFVFVTLLIAMVVRLLIPAFTGVLTSLPKLFGVKK